MFHIAMYLCKYMYILYVTCSQTAQFPSKLPHITYIHNIILKSATHLHATPPPPATSLISKKLLDRTLRVGTQDIIIAPITCHLLREASV